MGNAPCIFYNCGWMLITYIVNFKKNQKGSGQIENVMNSIFANSAKIQPMSQSDSLHPTASRNPQGMWPLSDDLQ